MMLDIIVVIICALAIFIGYRVGFLSYVVKIASIFTGILISLVFIGPVHEFVMQSSLGQSKIQHYVTEITTSGTLNGTTESLDSLLIDIGFPAIIAKVVDAFVYVDSDSNDFILSVATGIANITMWMKCFLFLMIGITIFTFFVKLFIKKIRTIKFVKVLDGFLGIVLSSLISIFVGYSILTIIYLFINAGMFDSFGIFMNEQLNESIGIYSYFYEHNFIQKFIDLLF